MPTLGKGPECIKLMVFQVSKAPRKTIIRALFLTFVACLSETKFMFSDQICKETCGMLAHLTGNSGVGKGQLSFCVEAIMRKFRAHDEAEMDKLVEWQRTVKSKREPCQKKHYNY